MPITDLGDLVSARDHLPLSYRCGDSTLAGLLDRYDLPSLNRFSYRNTFHLDRGCDPTVATRSWRPPALDRPEEVECGLCFDDPVFIAERLGLPDDVSRGLPVALLWYLWTRGGELMPGKAAMTMRSLARSIVWTSQLNGHTDNRDPRIRALWVDLVAEAETALANETWTVEMYASVLGELRLDPPSPAHLGLVDDEQVEVLTSSDDVASLEADAHYVRLRRWFTELAWVRGQFLADDYDPTSGFPPDILGATMVDYDPHTRAVLAPRVCVASWLEVGNEHLEVIDATGTAPRDLVIEACTASPTQAPGEAGAPISAVLQAMAATRL